MEIMRLSAPSLKIWVFETLAMEKSRFFLNADILIDEVSNLICKQRSFITYQ